MVDELFQRMCIRAAEQIEQIVVGKIRAALEKQFRGAVQVVFNETEAAKFLGVPRETLAAWRKRGLIEYAQYPVGRLRNGATEDDLSSTITYDAAALLSFRERYIVRAANGSGRYEIRPQVSLLGPEVQEKALRKVA